MQPFINISVNISFPIIRSRCKPSSPVYQAIIAENSDFEQVLVSPTMINDHFPDNVLDALRKVSFQFILI